MAKKDKGWVKVNRSILDSSIWKSSEPFDMRSAWIDLILMANHEEREVITKYHDVMRIPRGATLTSIRHLADRWGWSKNKVDRYTEMLKKAGMIEKIGTPSGTLITLVNYSVFQDRRDAQKDAGEDAEGTQTRTKQEYKNEKNEVRSNYDRPKPIEERFAAIERFARAKKGDEK